MSYDFVVMSCDESKSINDSILKAMNAGRLTVDFRRIVSDEISERDGGVFIFILDNENKAEMAKKAIRSFLEYRVNPCSCYVFMKQEIPIPIEWEFDVRIIVRSLASFSDASFFKYLRLYIKHYNEDKLLELNYEQLHEYDKIKSYNTATGFALNIANAAVDRLSESDGKYNVTKGLLRKLIVVLEKMSEYRIFDFSEDSKQIANKKLRLIEKILKYIKNAMKVISVSHVHLALFIMVYHYLEIIEVEALNTLGEGSVDISKKTDFSKISADTYEIFKSKAALPSILYDKFDEEMLKKVEVYANMTGKYERVCGEVEKTGEISEEDEQMLVSIAKFINEGNKIFSVISKERNSADFLNCLKTSYERLKAYCEIVGATDVAEDCVKKLFELKKIAENAGEEKSKMLEKADMGLKTLLGVKIAGSGEFDVFISHKSQDIDLATDVYNLLKKNLKTAFLDKISLPQISKSDYSDAIFHAIEASSHLIVILSDVKYLKEAWLKEEMRTFYNEIIDGRKPDANIIFVVSNEAYNQIMSDKTALPLQFRKYEIIKIEDCDKDGRLVSYIV